MKTTLIVTVLNEEKNVDKFFKSLFSQTKFPDELIIVDGGSDDKTVDKIGEQIKQNKKKFPIRLLIRKGNRSIGRNFAIKNSLNKIILATDFGCTLDRDWVKNISIPFENPKIDVVSGFYKPVTGSVFKKCLSTYTCVMANKVNKQEFLPSSRSIAFRKKVWEKNKYPEWLDTCEDLVFAKKIKEKGARFEFVREAFVNWQQKNNFREAFFQLLGYAKGDGRALFIRPQVPLIYLRYFLGLYFLFLCIIERSWQSLILFPVLISLYFAWAIKKNYRYVNNEKAFIFLPLLQVISDIAVLIGTTYGMIRRISLNKLISGVRDNKFLIFTLSIYIFLMLLTLDYGIPNKFHPFPYHMDEWHQLQAVRSTFAYGTPNVEGSANGTMLHFLISGFYLIPFTIIGLINPFELRIDDLMVRQNIFILLRLNTVIWGTLSIVLIYKIARLMKLPRRLALTLFTFTPIWLMLSGHFKYDIALMFFILLSLFFIMRFSKYPTSINFIIAGIPIGLALAVKISVLPLIPIYMLSYFMFQKKIIKNIRYLAIGLIIIFTTALLFGFPDTLFGTGNIYKYLYENLVIFPSATENFISNGNALFYVFLRHYSIIFGYGLFFLFIFSLLFWIYIFIKNGIKKSFFIYKLEIFFIASFFLFLMSLVSLKAYSGGNRALVLLPFIVITISLTLRKISLINNYRQIFSVFLLIALIIQIYFSLTWISIRNSKSIQTQSSEWLVQNVKKDTVVGLENIPIYQNVPDILQKEFYFKEYGVKNDYVFNYEIVSVNSKSLPPVIVITNDQVEGEILYKSPKKDLINKIENEGYIKIKVFKQDIGKLFLSDRDYAVAGLVSSPLTITIYKK